MFGVNLIDVEAIRTRVQSLNAAWREKRFDDLRAFFHPDAVIVAPGLEARIAGRDAVVESYRNFVASASIEAFELAEPVVDLWGDPAVVTAKFTITYSMDGKVFHEQGHDLLVFQRQGGEWLIVWRTLMSSEVSS